MVIIDEAHLFAMHGVSFRIHIHRLKQFFQKIFSSKERSYYPLFLAMSATINARLTANLSVLTTIGFPQCRCLWLYFGQFQQWYIKKEYSASENISVKGFDKIVELMKDFDDGCLCIFANF